MTENRAKIEFMFEEEKYFPECHASSLICTDNGDILAVYFAGKHEKADDVGIYLSKKTEKGWDEPYLLAKVNDEPHWNPVIYEFPGGIRVNFKVGKEIPDWTTWYTESFDGGRTWSSPLPCNAPVGPVRSKPVFLTNGTLIAPNSVETANDWRPRVDISHDNGRTFADITPISVNTADETDENFLSGKGAIQPTLWESENGHVHALLRTTAGFIFRADSEDYGKTFLSAYNTRIPNNNSGIDIVKAEGALYLVLNPVSGNWAARTPLSVYKSTDNGKTFEEFCVLADEKLDPKQDKGAELSYPAVIYKNGCLHISFTWMRRCIAYAKIDLNKI